MVEEKKTTHVNEFLCENGKLIKYIGNSTDVIIPDGISEIGFYVFSDNNRIESVTIPDTIKVIPTAAFCNCTRLKKVQLGRNVEKILPYAFGGCESLEEIRIPGSVKVLDRVVFKGCISLKRVQLEEGLRTITVGAFCKCCSLEEIVLPSSVRKINEFAFSKCTSLRRVEINSPYAKIAPNTFYLCPEDLQISWKNKAVYPEAAEQGMFVDWTGALHSYFGTKKIVIIPDYVKTIRSLAFLKIRTPFSVILSDSVKTIEWAAFASATGLESISLGKVEHIGRSAFAGTGLKEINIPDSLMAMGDDALHFCCSLKKVIFEGKNVNFQGRIASMCKNLEEVVLPSEQDTIPDYAFYDCKSLRTVSMPANTRLGKDVFKYCNLVEIVNQ